jgi:hypothetical protein
MVLSRVRPATASAITLHAASVHGA